MGTSFPEATPHGDIQEVFPDVFFVTGSVSLQGMQISRNMTIVREGTELSLINTVQMSFRHLLSGHGEPLKESAHEQFSRTFRELFNVQ